MVVSMYVCERNEEDFSESSKGREVESTGWRSCALQNSPSPSLGVGGTMNIDEIYFRKWELTALTTHLYISKCLIES